MSESDERLEDEAWQSYCRDLERWPNICSRPRTRLDDFKDYVLVAVFGLWAAAIVLAFPVGLLWLGYSIKDSLMLSWQVAILPILAWFAALIFLGPPIAFILFAAMPFIFGVYTPIEREAGYWGTARWAGALVCRLFHILCIGALIWLAGDVYWQCFYEREFSAVVYWFLPALGVMVLVILAFRLSEALA